MKTIIATLIFVVVGMTSFAQVKKDKKDTNKKMIADAEIGDQIIFLSMKPKYETIYGEIYSFKCVATINDIIRTPDYIIAIEIILENGEKYFLDSFLLFIYEEKGKVKMCDK
jgi:hypothetical protein